jgi:integrase
MRWSAVDLERRTVFLAMTKNGSSRAVPLSTRGVEVLRALTRSEDDRVFPVTENALKHVWVRACLTAGVDDLHFHDLRHEATSRLAEKLPNIVELAAVTGHRDVKMLARYYHPRTVDLVRKLN